MTDDREPMDDQDRRLRADLEAVAATTEPSGDWAEVVRRSAEPQLATPIGAARPGWSRRQRILVGTAAAALALVAGAVVAAGRDRDGGTRITNDPARPTTSLPSGPSTTLEPEPTATTAPAPSSTSTTTTSAPSTTTTTAPPIVGADPGAVALRVGCPAGVVTFPAGATAGPGGEALVLAGPLRADLDGDGREEAVVAARCSGGGAGAGATESVVVVRGGTGAPRQVGGPLPGASPTVVGRTLVVRETGAPEGPGGCCPPVTYVPYRVSGDAAVAGSSGLPGGDVASTDGIGPLRIGASFPDAAAALDGPIALTYEDDVQCGYLRLPGGDDPTDGLVGATAIRSITVTEPGVRTRSGIGVGSSVDEVRTTYAGQLSERPNDYDPDSRVLRLVADDSSRLVVFHVTGDRVVRFDVGDAEAADAPEGCH